MPSYKLSGINNSIREDPKGFVERCDARFNEKVLAAADKICEHIETSPIVLLSGPSGSGKTTTAKKIENVLDNRGYRCHSISMDDYFLNVDPKTAPRTPEGEMDFESPLCLDMDLLNEHFDMLSDGREIHIPHYVFSRQKRSTTRFTPLKLGEKDIAIFEGIHALNNDITDKHPEALKLYVSARSDIIGSDGRVVFKGTWMRLVRRAVRDNNFRGADALFTLGLWANVRRGEKLYISPYKNKADIIFDSSLPYEVSVMKEHAKSLFSSIPEGADRFEELSSILPAFDSFEDLDSSYVAPDSLLREFIGGSAYSYS